jgi:hypothetical protein
MSGLSGEEARQIVEAHGSVPKIFVETGTYVGTTLDAVCQEGIFDQLYSIELSRELHRQAKERFGEVANLILGDSAQILPRLCSSIVSPAFFWLDAHWCEGGASESPCPLFEELVAIAGRNAPDIVVVDDVHCFGRKWSDGPGGDWTAITRESISEVFSAERIEKSYSIDQKFVIHLRVGS